MYRNLINILITISFILISTHTITAKDSPIFDLSMKYEVERSIGQGLKYLMGNQKDNGSWGDYPGMTGLVLTAVLKAPEKSKINYKNNIIAGFKYLMTNIQPDGGIYPNFEPQLKAYNTSICLMAMVAANSPAFEENILRARQYLMSLQADEDDGLTKDSSTYGGIGYNRDERSDISNMQFALEALRASEEYQLLADTGDNIMQLGDSTDKPVESVNEELFWEKAILFLQRCQNYKKYNDYKWSGNDGGFVYYPGVSKAGGTTSYGGTTYAGMKSFIYAGLAKNDERVQAAYRWIKSHYTIEENPELGQQGLFYYYHVMAKALAIYGDSILVDTSNVAHDWHGDLADKLLSIQRTDGSWVNENGRWWENNPDLVTSYCIMALEELIK